MCRLFYVDMPAKPLYPFGFGLSYTKFAYSNLQIDRKAISKQELEAGEEKRVTFVLGAEELGVWDYEMKYVLEPGRVSVFVGTSSADVLKTELEIIL